jgi:hypothetical protein
MGGHWVDQMEARWVHLPSRVKSAPPGPGPLTSATLRV